MYGYKYQEAPTRTYPLLTNVLKFTYLHGRSDLAPSKLANWDREKYFMSISI